MLALALPGSLSQASIPDSDQPPSILRNQANPQHRLTTGGSIVTGGLATSGIPLKIFFFFSVFFQDNHGTFFFGRQREDGKGRENRKNKSIYNPVVHPKFLSLCTGGSKPPFQSAWAFRSAQAVWAYQRNSSLASACPKSQLQFEVAAMGLSSSRSMLELAGCRLL